MKKKFRLLVCLLTVLTILTLPMLDPLEGHAEETITYDFTGLAIPEGVDPTLTIDVGTMQLFHTNDEMITAFVQALAAKYNYGVNQIDQLTEINYIRGVLNGIVPGGVHRATYTTIQNSDGSLTYGNGTYIDINITTQLLAYFQNGQCVYLTSIVTGNPNKGNSTPKGVFTIQYKQRNRVLRGEDYESPVSYWMRFTGNVGIHDANWRSSFGDSIYLTNGSHGCVNVPPANMPYLYENCPVGTVVVVHDDEALLAEQAAAEQQKQVEAALAAWIAQQQAAEQAQ
ncbi:MAG: L,D-transpeptidase [Lachnospiraceae bacterium]|nr:L,D-transpeptidase [Lachnospiraceae bacterium]